MTSASETSDISSVRPLPPVQGVSGLNSDHKLTSVASIAQYDENGFVLANYQNLFYFDSNNSTICIINPVFFGLENNNKEKSVENRYNPTGVSFGPDKSLYVANYKGNNILSGEFKKETCEYYIHNSFSSSETGGPENVAVSDDTVISANYDSGTITAFSITTGEMLWSSAVPQAHGVTVDDGNVYATGLTDRRIYKLSLADGRLLKSKGQLGWDPSNEEFLWPTSVQVDSAGHLVVSDAQTGFISFLDKNSLEVIRYIGGNGPTAKWFNYPYSAIPTSRGIAVTQSMRSDLVFLSDDGSEVKSIYSTNESRWPIGIRLSEPFGKNWVGYVNEGESRFHIYGSNFKYGFASFHSEDGSKVYRAPNSGTLFNPGAYMYLMQGTGQKDQFSIAFSSSSSIMIGVVPDQSSVDMLIGLRLPFDSWLDENRIVFNGGSIDLDEIQVDLLNRASQLQEIVTTQGWLTPEELYEVVFSDYPHYKFDRMITYFNDTFRSSEAQRFKTVYDTFLDGDVSLQHLRSAASEYYKKITDEPYVDIDEYYLVGMLSGVRPSGVDKEQVSTNLYTDCKGEGHYYPDFGPAALQTSSLVDYLSAVDREGSVICVFPEDGQMVTGLRIGWHSPTEVPQEIAIYGVDAKSGQETLILNTSDFEAVEVRGYIYTEISLDPTDQYEQYMLKVLKGGEQDRLILRSLEVRYRR